MILRNIGFVESQRCFVNKGLYDGRGNCPNQKQCCIVRLPQILEIITVEEREAYDCIYTRLVEC
jgi:hypothetical protein